MIMGCVMDSNVNEMFGKNLKSLIKKVGLTQKKFGEELGVNKNTVYYWCKGKYIRLEDINKIIKYFLLNPKIKDFSPLWLITPEILDKDFNLPVETFIQGIKEEQKEYWEKKIGELRESKNKEIEKITSEKEKVSKHNATLIKRNDYLEKNYSKERELIEWEKELEEREENYKKKVEKELTQISKYWNGKNLTTYLFSNENIKKVIDSLIENSNRNDIKSNEFKYEVAVTVSKILSKYLIEEYIKILDK